jgi:hypothetical protein
MAAEHPAERPVQVPRHGTCPPLAASAGHDAKVSFRGSQGWACPPAIDVVRLRERLESGFLG